MCEFESKVVAHQHLDLAMPPARASTVEDTFTTTQATRFARAMTYCIAWCRTLARPVARRAAERPTSPATAGRVTLVGAGPGDPALLTLKAVRALNEADVVLYDRLVDRRVLHHTQRRARLIPVGKPIAYGNGHGWTQHAINTWLIELARDGAQVVRLKSGDPLIFGRADEELDALEAADITVDVIPGITAAVAAGSAIRRSLTRRGRNAELRLATAQDASGFAEQDWRALARDGAVAGFYMGVRAAKFVQGRLMLHGASPNTPVSIVENASLAQQRVLTGSLAELDRLIDVYEVRAPAVFFTGLAARESVDALRLIDAREQSQQGVS